MHCADAALYEVKLRGKKGSLVYDEGFDSEVRTQLGFALNDISENLPGAFIIYKADKEDDEILYANRELLRILKCDSLDMLLKYTNGSFRNLIREQEREDIEQRIWEQIEDGHSNDYVYYHMKKEDGSFISYKSGKIDEELAQAENAVKILGGKVQDVVKFPLMDTDMDRSFVVIKKMKPTAKKYPRKAGLPAKEPLA